MSHPDYNRNERERNKVIKINQQNDVEQLEFWINLSNRGVGVPRGWDLRRASRKRKLWVKVRLYDSFQGLASIFSDV